jgi:hypothetical protein
MRDGRPNLDRDRTYHQRRSALGGKVIFFSVGLPGRFADWCDAVIARLAGSLGGPVVVTQWPSVDEMLGYHPVGRVLDQIGLILMRDAPAQLVIGARQPDERLRAAFAGTKVPFIVALDDPRGAVVDILVKTGAEPAAATRAVANSCPFIMRHLALPDALTLHARNARSDPCGTVSAIADHLRIPITESQAAEIADDLAQGGLVPIEAYGSEGAQFLPERRRKMLDGALAPYGEFFAGANISQFVWTRDLFALVGNPTEKPAHVIDVSGGARCLIYGPYIHLTPGSWTARVVLGFSREATGHIFLVDACCSDQQLAATSFRPNNAGIQSAEISFSLGEETGQGVEIRVMVLDEHAKGYLAFGHVALTPLVLQHSDGATQPRDNFEAVLEL